MGQKFPLDTEDSHVIGTTRIHRPRGEAPGEAPAGAGQVPHNQSDEDDDDEDDD